MFMDVDGTLTDGKLYIGHNGEVMKAFSVKDGFGIKLLSDEYGVTPIVLTGRISMIVKKRCKELGIRELYQGVKNKVELIRSYCDFFTPASISYIGDDINDLEAISYVNSIGGVTACPADAAAAVKEAVTYLCEHKGGEGAVRDFTEYMIVNKLVSKINEQ